MSDTCQVVENNGTICHNSKAYIVRSIKCPFMTWCHYYCNKHCLDWLMGAIKYMLKIKIRTGYKLTDNNTLYLDRWIIVIKRTGVESDMLSPIKLSVDSIFKHVSNVMKFLPEDEDLKIFLYVYYGVSKADLLNIPEDLGNVATPYGIFKEIKINNISQAHYYPNKSNMYLYPLWIQFIINK